MELAQACFDFLPWRAQAGRRRLGRRRHLRPQLSRIRTRPVASISPFPVDLAAQAQRRRVRMAQWRRRSRLIHVMRKALPAAIVAILVLLAGWILARGILARIGDLTRPARRRHPHDQRPVLRPRRSGPAPMCSAPRRPAATTSIPTASILVDPQLVFDAENVKDSHISADQGVYRKDTRILSLRGHVVVARPVRRRFRSPTRRSSTRCTA